MKRWPVVVVLLAFVGLVMGLTFMVVQQRMEHGMSPPGDGAELTYRVESPDADAAASGRRHVGSEGTSESDQAEDPDGPEPGSKAERLQWIREWTEIAVEPGYSFQDLWKAQRALLEFDPAEVIPILLEVAASPEGQRFGWGRALSIIGDFGKRAGPWVTELIELLPQYEDRCWAVAQALGRIGEPATQALVDVLADDDDSTRRFVFSALAMHRKFTREQAEAITRFLDHERVDVRKGAAGAFAAANTASEVVVPAMIEALSDDDEDVQTQAAMVLWNYGEKAAAAVAALAGVIDDRDSGARSIAVMTLGRIGDGAAGETARLIALFEESPPAWDPSVPDTLASFGVEALVTAMRSDRPRVRLAMATRLGMRGGDDLPAAIEALTAALADEDVSVRKEAVDSLGGYGAAARSALPQVLRLTKDEYASVRHVALIAAARIDGESPEVFSVLLRELTEGPDLARGAAAEALGSIGPRATAAVDPLAVALSDSDAYVRRHAAIALEKIGREAISAASELARTIQDDDARVGLAAAIALMAVDPPGVAARDAVGEFRIHDDPNVRRQLMEGIRRHPDAIWLPVVINRLEDREPRVRMMAARAVGKFGALAKPYVALLLERLDADLNGDVRMAIIIAFGELGAVAADAVPTLERLAADRKWARWAQPALDRIR